VSNCQAAFVDARSVNVRIGVYRRSVCTGFYSRSVSDYGMAPVGTAPVGMAPIPTISRMPTYLTCLMGRCVNPRIRSKKTNEVDRDVRDAQFPRTPTPCTKATV
jgi:hypothetical protein